MSTLAAATILVWGSQWARLGWGQDGPIWGKTGQRTPPPMKVFLENRFGNGHGYLGNAIRNKLIARIINISDQRWSHQECDRCLAHSSSNVSLLCYFLIFFQNAQSFRSLSASDWEHRNEQKWHKYVFSMIAHSRASALCSETRGAQALLPRHIGLLVSGAPLLWHPSASINALRGGVGGVGGEPTSGKRCSAEADGRSLGSFGCVI